MKYGIIAKEEWNAEEEGWGDDTFCVVFLNDMGVIAVDELVQNMTGVVMGMGWVWEYVDGKVYRKGVHPIPMDTLFYGLFETEQDAVAYRLTEYQNDTVQTEQAINDQTLMNTLIDALWYDSAERKRDRRYLAVIACCIVLILIVLGLAYIKAQLGGA